MTGNDIGMAGNGIQPFNFTYVGDIYDEPEEEVDYCVDELLPGGSLSLLAGKPKAGKSTLARQLAVCVAQGRNFLGRATQQGSVLYMALEEKRSEVMAHFKLLGLTKDDPVYIICGAVKKQNAVAMLEASIKAIPDVTLVIVDPIFKFVGVKDSSDYVQVSDGFERLMEVARNNDITVLALHHLKKRESDDQTDGALGSTAIVGGVDTFLVLKKEAGNEVCLLSSEQRYGKSLQPTQLRWSEVTRELSMGPAFAEVEEMRSRRTGDRILNDMVRYVEDHPGCTQETLIRAVTGNVAVKKSTMRSLIDGGRFDQVGTGTKGDPYKYLLAGLDQPASLSVEEQPTHEFYESGVAVLQTREAESI